MTWLIVIAGIALGTYVARVAGPVVGARWRLAPRAGELFEIAPVVLLFSVALVATFSGEAGASIGVAPSRLAGVLVGAWLAWRGQDMAVVVVAAAATTAFLRGVLGA